LLWRARHLTAQPTGQPAVQKLSDLRLQIDELSGEFQLLRIDLRNHSLHRMVDCLFAGIDIDIDLDDIAGLVVIGIRRHHEAAQRPFRGLIRLPANPKSNRWLLRPPVSPPFGAVFTDYFHRTRPNTKRSELVVAPVLTSQPFKLPYPARRADTIKSRKSAKNQPK
jgi:hypothetical protein